MKNKKLQRELTTQTMRVIFALLLSVVFFTSVVVRAETYVSVEGDLTWQSRNDQRIPGEGGTDFSFAKFKSGPFPSSRLYVGTVWNKRHEVRALYAPLAIELNGRFDQPVKFIGQTFAANTDTVGFYKFNSYRLTYAYHMDKAGAWEWAAGFTAKIRDAEVKLTQGTLSESKKNVGFVPLLHFQAVRALDANWSFRFDFDGLAAPQGRAFDVALFLERKLSQPGLSFFTGYRTIEGGADNKEVYNFAWIHKAVVGFRGQF